MVFSITLMNVLLGVGNKSNGDDGIGVYVARKFKHKDWIAIDCATVPENYIGKIVRYKPKKVVIIDAADMGLKPGEIRRIPKEKVGKASFSTHSIPLSLFISHLKELTGADITLIGIQPKSLYGKMSKEVKEAAEKVIEYIKEERIDEIEELK